MSDKAKCQTWLMTPYINNYSKNGSSRLNERRECAIERHLCCATVSEKEKKKIFPPYGKKIHKISVRKSGFLLTLMLLVSIDCQNNSKQKVNRREAGRFEHLKRDFSEVFSAVNRNLALCTAQTHVLSCDVTGEIHPQTHAQHWILAGCPFAAPA